MDKLVFPFVKDKFPDFVVSGHEKFQLFVEAYYEFLEKENTGTATSVKNLFNELPNASGLIVNGDINKDIDETLEQFIQFFRRDVLPITINDTGVDQRTLLKKIRDLYLTKGSPKSYKLLFRLLFDKNVNIFETKNSILKASDGNYLRFNYSIFRVVDAAFNLEYLDYTFATITGNGVSGDVVSGIYINKDKNNRPIIKTLLGDEYKIEIGKIYTITSLTDENIFIKVEALPLLDSIEIEERGALNAPGDPIVLKSDRFNTTYTGYITSVSLGSVENLFVTTRGFNYVVGDEVRFTSKNPVDGQGGRMRITSADSLGRVTSIDDFALRTTDEFDGFLAGDLVDVSIPVSNGGKWRAIPQVNYIVRGEERTYGLPYNQFEYGSGMRATATSTTIGGIENFAFPVKPYFDSEGDTNLTLPGQFLLQGLDGIQVGNTVALQKLVRQRPNLYDDSEPFVMTFQYKRQFLTGGLNNNTTWEAGQPKPWPEKITIPVGYDSDDFRWISSSFSIDSELGIADSENGYLISNFTKDYRYQIEDSETNDNDIGVLSDEIDIIDGGVSVNYGTSTVYWTSPTTSTPYSVDGGVVDSDFNLILGSGTSGLDVGALIRNYTYNNTGRLFNYGIIAILDTIIDGGNSYGSSANAQLDGGNVYSGTIANLIVGALTANYEYNKYIGQTIIINIGKTTEFVNQIDTYHFEKLYNLNNVNDVTFNYGSLRTIMTERLPPDAASWINTGHYGVVTGVRPDENIVTVQAHNTLKYFTNDSDINSIPDEKYELLRLGVYDGIKDSDSVNLPLTNIVAQFALPKATYKLAGTTFTESSFANGQGFISNVDQVIQDNYYYSNFTYVVSTTVPISEWREKVRMLLHPAGTYMFANLNVIQPVEYTIASTVEADYSKPRTVAFTFDTSLEHYDTKFRAEGIYADNILYSANSFEFVTSNEPLGRQLTPSVYYENTVGKYNYQLGDSWWDFEPLGLCADWTTQVNDNGYVKIGNVYNKDSRKPRTNFPKLFGNSFVNVDRESYDAYDSDEFLQMSSNAISAITRFSDSDQTKAYNQFNYLNLKNVGITRVDGTTTRELGTKVVNTKRKSELLKMQEKDFASCLMGEEFTYVVAGITFSGFDAFERKWNAASNRTYNIGGWHVTGYHSKVQNNAGTKSYRKLQYTRLKDIDPMVNNLRKSMLPNSVDVGNGVQWWNWNDTYNIKINTNSTIETSKVVIEPSFDPSNYMKKRRGS